MTPTMKPISAPCGFAAGPLGPGIALCGFAAGPLGPGILGDIDR